MGAAKYTVYDLAKHQWMLALIRLPEAPARQEDPEGPDAVGAATRAGAAGPAGADGGGSAMQGAGASRPDGLAEVILSDEEDALAHLSDDDDDDEASSEGGWTAGRMDCCTCTDACSLKTCCYASPLRTSSAQVPTTVNSMAPCTAVKLLKHP